MVFDNLPIFITINYAQATCFKHIRNVEMYGISNQFSHKKMWGRRLTSVKILFFIIYIPKIILYIVMNQTVIFKKIALIDIIN